MKPEAWITVLLSFLGAITGSWVAVRYARHAAYEKPLGELSAKRRLDLIEQLATYLHETLGLLDLAEGAPSTTFKESDSAAMLDAFERILPLVRIYLGDEMYGLMRDIRFWAFVTVEKYSGYNKPESEPSFSKAWGLLAQAAREGLGRKR